LIVIATHFDTDSKEGRTGAKSLGKVPRVNDHYPKWTASRVGRASEPILPRVGANKRESW